MVIAGYRSFMVVWLAPLLLTAGCTTPARLMHTGAPAASCFPMTVNMAVTDTAERHYDAMLACIKMKDFYQATAYYALAGVQTWYDYLANPAAASKQRHQSELRKRLDKLNESDKRQFWEALNIAMRDDKQLHQLCNWLDIPENTPLSKMLWDEARNGYLHCDRYHRF